MSETSANIIHQANEISKTVSTTAIPGAIRQLAAQKVQEELAEYIDATGNEKKMAALLTRCRAHQHMLTLQNGESFYFPIADGVPASLLVLGKATTLKELSMFEKLDTVAKMDAMQGTLEHHGPETAVVAGPLFDRYRHYAMLEMAKSMPEFKMICDNEPQMLPRPRKGSKLNGIRLPDDTALAVLARMASNIRFDPDDAFGHALVDMLEKPTLKAMRHEAEAMRRRDYSHFMQHEAIDTALKLATNHLLRRLPEEYRAQAAEASAQR